MTHSFYLGRTLILGFMPHVPGEPIDLSKEGRGSATESGLRLLEAGPGRPGGHRGPPGAAEAPTNRLAPTGGSVRRTSGAGGGGEVGGSFCWGWGESRAQNRIDEGKGGSQPEAAEICLLNALHGSG